MKKIAVGIVIMLGLTFLQPANAEVKKSIVIIDTAIDTTLPELQGKIIHEVCLMEELRCPNGKSFQEGPGSATLPAPQVSSNGFEHGTRMAQVATKINPELNIVFIRIFPMTKNGTIAYSSANANSTIKQALDWTIINKSKFNIVAVSASLGHSMTKTASDYCFMNKRTDNNLKSSLSSLKSMGVGVAFAAGNNRDKQRIDYPSCLPEAIGISSVSDRGNTEVYANDSLETDFYSLGRYDISNTSVSGTSAATAAFAAYWAKSYRGNYQSTYDYLKSVATTSDTNKINTVVDVLK
jgi:hypothetical protein